MCVFGSIYGVIFKRVERRSSFRLGLGGFTLHLALLLTITAATTAARNGAACGEGEVTTPERERKEFINEKKTKKNKQKNKEDISNVFFELKCNVYKEM